MVLNKSTSLKWGRLQLEYGQGKIRYLKWGQTEILRMVYSAVRDENWSTVDGQISDEIILKWGNGFSCQFQVLYTQNEISYKEKITISAHEHQLFITCEGEALSTFKKNRIGFCVLHPVKECAGKECVVIHSDNIRSVYTFPEAISPEQPIKNIRLMEWEPTAGLKAKIEFEGDIFEMEDQRNWTDASYKTYCTPLELPFPATIRKGEKVWQKIVVSVEPDSSGLSENNKPDEHIITLNEQQEYHLPGIGTCASSTKETLSDDEIELLKQLPLSHYRVEIKLFEESWQEKLASAIKVSKKLNWPLFIVAYFSENASEELAALANEFQKTDAPVKHFMAVGKNHISNNQLTEMVVGTLRKYLPDATFGGGVNAYFAELNRNRPATDTIDFVNYTISPQVHAFDNLSLIENLAAQADTVKSAKTLFPGMKIFVSPVTLKQRFNVVATSEEKVLQPGILPPQTDTRQRTNFAAMWLMGSIKYLAESGAGLITFFETVGWRGFIQGVNEPDLPKLFPAKKSDIFPVYHLLEEFTSFERVLKSTSSHPLKFDCIVLKNNKEIKLLVANFTYESTKVKLGTTVNFNTCNSLLNKDKITFKNNILHLSSNDIVVLKKTI